MKSRKCARTCRCRTYRATAAPSQPWTDNSVAGLSRSKFLYGFSPYNEHMSSPVKNDRIDLRVSAEQKAEISEAADLLGVSTSAFIQRAALSAAREALAESRKITLRRESWRVFIDAIDTPARVDPKLASLLARESVFEE